MAYKGSYTCMKVMPAGVLLLMLQPAQKADSYFLFAGI